MMTKSYFQGIKPLVMYWTHEAICDLIDELLNARGNNVRKLSKESGVSYDVLKDYAQRTTRPKPAKFDVFNLQKLLALKGEDLNSNKSESKIHIALTLKDLSLSVLRKSRNILLYSQYPQDKQPEAPSVVIELSPSEANLLAELLNNKAIEAQASV